MLTSLAKRVFYFCAQLCIGIICLLVEILISPLCQVKVLSSEFSILPSDHLHDQ